MGIEERGYMQAGRRDDFDEDDWDVWEEEDDDLDWDDDDDDDDDDNDGDDDSDDIRDPDYQLPASRRALSGV